MQNNDFLLDGERLDDLCLDGRFIISHKDKYCFTSDSVMLANMVRANSKSKVVDLCAGGGIISILIALKTSCQKSHRGGNSRGYGKYGNKICRYE